MHTGTDINEQIPDIEAQRAVKSNIFGKGFEDGSATSLGCSYKGKIWAMESSTVYSWMNWCKNVGRKILDDTIDTNPHCQNSCHPHPNNLNGGKGDNHGTIQCRTQTSNIKQTAIA